MKQKNKEDSQEQTDNCTKRNNQSAVGLDGVFWRVGGLIDCYRMLSFCFNFDRVQQRKLLLKIT